MTRVARIARIVRDSRGASMIEFALVLPVLVLFIYGTYVFGQLFEANAGMQHALGEGARYANLCLNPTPAAGCTVPTNDQIRTRIRNSFFGSAMGSFATPTVSDGPSGSNYKTLSVTYTMPMNFIFFRLPNVTLTQSKQVYTA
jgi:Flp pilus assembly protein TadG